MDEINYKDPKMECVENEKCPMCQKDTLTLYETEQDVPHFGKIFIFGMQCKDAECNYKQNDVESEKASDPCKIEFTTTNAKDMQVRVVKSSEATIKIPTLRMSVEPGIASDGYVSNVEGLLQRFKKIVEAERDTADEPEVKKKAKNLLKKLWKIECGDEPVKIVIEDPSGNSAIISEKAVISKLKVSKK